MDKTLTRKERERLTRRQDIITAAREVFAIRGYADATLDEIAARAEFGKGTLYGYFENKEDLFEAVIVEGLDDLLSLAQKNFDNSEEALTDSYRRFAREMLTFLVENRALFTLIMREVHRVSPRQALLEKFQTLITEMEKPLLRSLPAEIRERFNTSHIAFMYLTNVFTLYRCVAPPLDSHCLFTPLQVSRASTESETAAALGLLDLVFFDGLQSVAASGDTH